MIPLRRRIRQIWRRIFPPRAIRIPGKFPWVQPAPLPFGTPLILDSKGRPKVVADGHGGVQPDGPIPIASASMRWTEDDGKVVHGVHIAISDSPVPPRHPGARRPKIG